ncbi:MAG: hypothetical protein ACRERD_32940 [Candidatus Binatia bacterium]
MTSRKIKRLQRKWIAEGAESDLGLWWPADDVRDQLGPMATEEEVRRETLAALTPLLRSGQLRAVDLEHGGGYTEWLGSPDSHLERINTEWQALGRPPTIGDIVWFIGPRGGP